MPIHLIGYLTNSDRLNKDGWMFNLSDGSRGSLSLLEAKGWQIVGIRDRYFFFAKRDEPVNRNPYSLDK